MSQLSNPPFPGQDSNPNTPSNDRVLRPTNGFRDNEGISSFFANIRGFGVQRTNLFLVRILPPNILFRTGEATLEKYRILELTAEGVNLPGVNLSTIQNRRHGVGYQQRYVNDVTFNDLSITFINTGDMFITEIFTQWMNSMVRFDSFMESAGTSTTGLQPFEIEYKSEYIAGDFYIDVFDERKDVVVSYRILEAFPISMSDISLGWGNNDEYSKFTVNFAYSFWNVTYNKARPAPVFENPQP